MLESVSCICCGDGFQGLLDCRIEGLTCARLGHADHAVTRDEAGKLLLAHMLGPGRTLRDDQVAHIGCAVVDPYLSTEPILPWTYAGVRQCPGGEPTRIRTLSCGLNLAVMVTSPAMQARKYQR